MHSNLNVRSGCSLSRRPFLLSTKVRCGGVCLTRYRVLRIEWYAMTSFRNIAEELQTPARLEAEGSQQDKGAIDEPCDSILTGRITVAWA